LVFAHTIALRRNQPDACSANATRHGTPIRFFAGNGDRLRVPGSRPAVMPPLVS